MRRRRYVLGAVAILALGAAAAATLVLTLSGGGGKPTERDYLARVSSVCRGYARRLERVPAPTDLAAYGDVIDRVDQALPVLRRQEAAMRAVPPPADLKPRLDRLFALDRRSVARLEAALAAARRRELAGVAKGLTGFTAARDDAHALSTAIGIRCELR